jgi:hypothetical protein
MVAYDASMRQLRLWLFFLAACGHDAAVGATKKPPTSPCEAAADHMHSLAPLDMNPRFRDVFAKHCQEDHWSVALQQCLIAATTLDEGDRCEALLTREQSEAVRFDNNAVRNHKN